MWIGPIGCPFLPLANQKTKNMTRQQEREIQTAKIYLQYSNATFNDYCSFSLIHKLLLRFIRLWWLTLNELVSHKCDSSLMPRKFQLGALIISDERVLRMLAHILWSKCKKMLMENESNKAVAKYFSHLSERVMQCNNLMGSTPKYWFWSPF